MKSFLRTATFASAIAACLSSHVGAQQLTESNYDQLVPAGKEVDAIYGDFAIRNKAATAIVAFTRSSYVAMRSRCASTS